MGDIITNFVEVEVFKWSGDEPTQAIVSIDKWSLVGDSSGTPGDFNSDGYVDGL